MITLLARRRRKDSETTGILVISFTTTIPKSTKYPLREQDDRNTALAAMPVFTKIGGACGDTDDVCPRVNRGSDDRSS